MSLLKLIDALFAKRTDRTLASKEATIALQVYRAEATVYLKRKMARQKHRRMRRVLRMAMRLVLERQKAVQTAKPSNVERAMYEQSA